MKPLILIFASAFLVASVASAQTTRPTLAVSLGFDGVFKPDNWSPVYVTLADADRRAGTIEMRVAHARVGHDVVARVAANPDAQTFTLYAPLGLLDAAQVQFRDARGTLLARQDLGDAIAGTPSAFAVTSVGVSGETAAARRVANALTRDTGESVAAGAIEARLLPERAIGYRAIDVLVLAGLDADAIDDRVEAAILDWVRAGGVLIAWPGAQRATTDSPLGVALPADVGDVAVRSIDGVEHVARTLTRRAGDDVADLSDAGVTTFRRRVGLGQIVLTNVDPTTIAEASVDARLAPWRRLTEDEFSLLPGDRRRGVFDPLVAQSLAEQSIRDAAPATPASAHAWLWVVLGVGLLLGPAEIALLVVAGRHPRTPLTLAGLGVVVTGGIALLVVRDRAGDVASAEVIVDDAVRVAVTTAAPTEDAEGTQWLGGDAADPRRQPAGALRLAQREERFVPATTWLADGMSRPLTRSVEFHPTPAASSSSLIATVTPTDVRLADAAPIASDDPATVRVETGLERLAARPEWSALLMDRTLASRLVRLQEMEHATLVVTRNGDAKDARFVVRVTRP